MSVLAVGLIRLYQRLAPAWVRSSCRFMPTCSEYAILAIQHYGLLDGGRRAIGRFRRCHPPNGGRDDPY
jgi:uncharacterized protein